MADETVLKKRGERRTRRTRRKVEAPVHGEEAVTQVQATEGDENVKPAPVTVPEQEHLPGQPGHHEQRAPHERLQRRSRKDEASVVPAADVLDAFFEGLEVGKSVILTRTSDGIKVLGVEVRPAKPAGKTRKMSNEPFVSDEFRTHAQEWQALSAEEQRAEAAKLGVSWEECDKPRVDHMRMTIAVRKHLGVERYREGYRTRQERDEAKRSILAGELAEEDI